MAVRRLSSRYWRWVLLRAATRVAPRLKQRFPLCETVVPAREAGEITLVTEEQPVSMTPEELQYTRGFDRPVPPVVERSIALVRLENATVLGSTGAVIDEERGTLFQSRYNAARYSPGVVSYHDFRLAPQRLVERPSANYFSMLGEHRGHRHFFHFLFDRLPRLHYLLTRFDIGHEPIVVLTNENPPGFQRDIYRFLQQRFANLSFASMPERERWCLPMLYLIDEDQPVRRTLLPPETAAFIRELVIAGYGIEPAAPHRRLYINRSDTRKRRIVNEAEIWPSFEARGFESIAAARFSFRDQVALFAEAEMVAGPHGAGFSNLLFAPAGTKVLEISNLEKVKDTYFLLTKALGQHHVPVVGSKGDRNEWFRVDPAQIEGALAKLDALPFP
ncbi:MAG TPA: glycosyltransferase family 61 protein [Rhizomicrobium sp.]